MRIYGLALALAMGVALAAAPTAVAVVCNITLNPVGDSGMSGRATTISAEISGPRPWYMVEANVRMNQMPPENMVYEAWLVDNDTNYKYSLGAFGGQNLTFRGHLVRFEGTVPYETLAVSTEPIRDMNPMPTTVVAQGNLPGSLVSAEDFPRQAVLPEDETFQRQVVTQRFGLDSEQVAGLRMSGWSYLDIAAVANAASRCNKQPSEIARMLEQGQTWDQVAQACNTTVARLLEPVPPIAVAGARMELRPGVAPPPGMISPPVFYQRLPNGRPVVDQPTWDMLRKQGYDWRDVATAANIAASTGESVQDLLRMTRIQGRTWRWIAIERGLDLDDVMDVSGWPFSRDEEEMPAQPSPAPSPAAKPPMS